ncbi:MAG TPA: hypothetical protein VJT49_05150 [Amycolatopsis sp.]|uniref:hypothetical protein n=1 Tax=Amycolatopsis sp. TaxID=37632 RepID=UPI002B4A9303|nr:hypothetical protein [Amycolatopsis sp.]HKS44494.1 hypothetical protein [Amycolatopsis sp.]
MSRIEPNTHQPNDGAGGPSPDSTSNGVLVIRFWREYPGPGGFRARVSRTADIAHKPRSSNLVTSVDEVRRLVEAWLHECASQ